MILFYFNQNCKFLERLIQVHKLLFLIGQGLWDALFKNLPLHPWTCGKPKIHREHVHLVESCHIPGLVKGCIVIASYINEIIHAEHVCKPLLKKELYVWVDKLMRVKCLFRIYPYLQITSLLFSSNCISVRWSQVLFLLASVHIRS